MSNAMWSKRGKKAGNSKRGSKMFWMWRERAQKVKVPTEKKRKEGGSSTATKSVGESERA